MRKLINYIRSCFCKHEFELIFNAEGITLYRKVYRCRKCGYVQKVEN